MSIWLRFSEVSALIEHKDRALHLSIYKMKRSVDGLLLVRFSDVWK